ncbi:hypothetical protein DPMN_001816 [Dreissena polymorpha]|uniref:Uncharacterized protein n=1 Tax=Dreissena polymorpha TaxID=45954 RepID=A0A9D4RQN3_DREPO|nr:hypothetical protein DPMN_001816 [Dreissena polymorpha]
MDIQLEYPNHVRDREDSAGGRRDEEVQRQHHTNERIKMDWFWAKAFDFLRV